MWDMVNSKSGRPYKGDFATRFAMEPLCVWDNYKIFIDIYHGVIISAGHTNMDETDIFCVTDENPKWDVLGSVLFEFYRRRKEYGNLFYDIACSLDRNAKEYKTFRKNMEVFLQKENSPLEEMIKKNNAILEKI